MAREISPPPSPPTASPPDGIERDALLAQLRDLLPPRTNASQLTAALQQLGVNPGCGATESAGNPAGFADLLITLIDHLPVGIAISDADLRLLHFNRRARALLGFPESLFEAGMPTFHDLFYFNACRGEYGPGDPAEIAAQLVARARRFVPHQFERQRPDGTVLDVRGEPLPGGGFVTIWSDVTLRHRAEQALKEEERKLRMIMDNLPGTVIYLDHQLVFQYCNPRFAALIGSADVDAVVGRAFADVFGEAVAAEIEPFYREAQAGRTTSYCRDVTVPNVGHRIIQVTVVPQTAAADKVVGVFALGIDITALVEAEAQLRRRNEELETLNGKLQSTQAQLIQSEKMASVGQLAAGVAHEINNPVGFVLSNFGALKRYAGQLFEVLNAYERLEAAPADPALQRALQQAKDDADLAYLKDDIPELISESEDGLGRVKRIIQNLKDFSRAGSDDSWELADLEGCLESTINIAWNELKYKAEIRREYGGIAPVECIPSQLNQVFLNMLVNAGHAIAERGVITVRSAEVGNEVRIDISDTGSGMSPEVMKRIFEPFFTTKPIGTGTGLGLALSYGIIEKHGGRIDVQSTPGQGTQFSIWLSKLRPAESSPT